MRPKKCDENQERRDLLDAFMHAAVFPRDFAEWLPKSKRIETTPEFSGAAAFVRHLDPDTLWGQNRKLFLMAVQIELLRNKWPAHGARSQEASKRPRPTDEKLSLAPPKPPPCRLPGPCTDPFAFLLSPFPPPKPEDTSSPIHHMVNWCQAMTREDHRFATGWSDRDVRFVIRGIPGAKSVAKRQHGGRGKARLESFPWEVNREVLAEWLRNDRPRARCVVAARHNFAAEYLHHLAAEFLKHRLFEDLARFGCWLDGNSNIASTVGGAGALSDLLSRIVQLILDSRKGVILKRDARPGPDSAKSFSRFFESTCADLKHGKSLADYVGVGELSGKLGPQA